MVETVAHVLAIFADDADAEPEPHAHLPPSEALTILRASPPPHNQPPPWLRAMLGIDGLWDDDSS